MLTAHEPSIKPLANIVSCYICSDRQYKRKNTFHFSHLPSRINGRARPQTHYTTRFAKKIQGMPRAGLSYRGKASLRTTSQSASQTAPLVGEPLAKRRSFPPCQSLSLWERWHCEAMTERASPAGKSRKGSDGQALCQSDTIAVPVILGQRPCPLRRSAPAPPKGEPLACRSAFVWTLKARRGAKGRALLQRLGSVFVQPLSLASLDSSPSRGASGETVHFAGTAKASPR